MFNVVLEQVNFLYDNGYKRLRDLNKELILTQCIRNKVPHTGTEVIEAGGKIFYQDMNRDHPHYVIALDDDLKQLLIVAQFEAMALRKEEAEVKNYLSMLWTTNIMYTKNHERLLPEGLRRLPITERALATINHPQTYSHIPANAKENIEKMVAVIKERLLENMLVDT